MEKKKKGANDFFTKLTADVVRFCEVYNDLVDFESQFESQKEDEFKEQQDVVFFAALRIAIALAWATGIELVDGKFVLPNDTGEENGN